MPKIITPIKRRLPFQAALFDFDGTLTRPGTINFEAIRNAIGCPQASPILEYIDQIKDPLTRERKHAVLHALEMDAAAKAQPNDDAEILLTALKKKGVKLGVITRNGLDQLKRSLDNFKETELSFFDVIVTRETNVPHKPSGLSVLNALEAVNVPPRAAIMVGDFSYDIMAGQAAGVRTVFLRNNINQHLEPTGADITISRLAELMTML